MFHRSDVQTLKALTLKNMYIWYLLLTWDGIHFSSSALWHHVTTCHNTEC